MNDKDYINKCLDWIENIKPSQQNAAIWLKMKLKFVPRVRAYVNGEQLKDEVVETPDSFEIAKKIFE